MSPTDCHMYFQEKEKEAKSYIVEAKKILDVTHGLNSPFARQHIFPLIREISMCCRFSNQLSIP